MDFLEYFKTRWSKISEGGENYRLLCSQDNCSLSCANLKSGKISVTSVHGTERHSYEFKKNDMAFAMIKFLDSLTEQEIKTFNKIFNIMSPRMTLKLERKEEE